MNERFLPIGTIVVLKGAKKPIMVTSYFIFSKAKEDDRIFDYGGCPYPIGLVDPNSSFAFNHDDIEKVVHLGYVDEDHKKLSKTLTDTEKEIKEKIKEEMSKMDKKEA
jgi:hypothetical protein